MNDRNEFETLLNIVAGQFEGPPARPRLDWADDLAIDILADAQRNSFRDARKLIAARLRFIRRTAHHG